MTTHTRWREQLKQLPFIKSLRMQYLFLALLLATVVASYSWLTGRWVTANGSVNSNNIEQRIKVGDLSHQLHTAIVEANNILNLYLLAPSDKDRDTFRQRLKLANSHLAQLLQIDWIAEGKMAAVLLTLKPVLYQLESIGEEVMTVRQTVNLMYPAMRVANGEMLEVNKQFLFETGNAIRVLESRPRTSLTAQEHRVLRLLIDAHDKWQGMIATYRLYLINRLGSLHEDVLPTQINDVDILFNQISDNTRKLNLVAKRNKLDLEVVIATEQMHDLSRQWYNGFKEVLRINTKEHWRGDIPLLTDSFYPLLTQAYQKLNQLDDELKLSADADLLGQAEVGNTIMQSLWGMALFVFCVAIVSLVVLEYNFIRPIASVARSLKDEAQGKQVDQLPDVQTTEIRDLTDAFREMRQQVHSRQMALEHIAMHDSLTSLPNRVLLMDRLNQAIMNASKRHRTLALVMLDLNRFKEINDTLGHQTGDALLQQVGARLREVLRDSDTVARLGGDEFAVLITNISETNAMRIAGTILEALEKVYEVYEHSLYVGVSLGVAIFPQHGVTAEILLQHADVAMYTAKRSNNGITIYDIQRDQHSVSQLSILSDLREAVENNEFYLEYQPELSMNNGSIIGVEALLRWRHPVHGIVMPDNFIPTAEQTGLIKRISQWVLDRAIQDCLRLHTLGHKISLSVNLSVWDVQDTSLALSIRNKLEQYGFPANYLMLEITERVMMAEPERAHQVLKELDKMGVKIVIDDFGTGFSSLVYLKHLPVNMLKVDKSFVMDMFNVESNATIVHSIIDLAHNLGLQVIAEGVENDQAWIWLKKWNCDIAQGYYISHPLTLIDLERYLISSVNERLLG